MSTNPNEMTLPEIAKRWGVSIRMIQYHIARGTLNKIKGRNSVDFNDVRRVEYMRTWPSVRDYEAEFLSEFGVSSSTYWDLVRGSVGAPGFLPIYRVDSDQIGLYRINPNELVEFLNRLRVAYKNQHELHAKSKRSKAV